METIKTQVSQDKKALADALYNALLQLQAELAEALSQEFALVEQAQVEQAQADEAEQLWESLSDEEQKLILFSEYMDAM